MPKEEVTVSIRHATLSLVVLSAALLAMGGSASARVVPAAKPPCTAVAKGAHWTYKGQKGTAYTVLGVNGASCTVGVKWLVRLTSHHGYLVAGPAGWKCIVTSVVGECTLKNGGIFEWGPKLKK